jgi:hypothetical protein
LLQSYNSSLYSYIYGLLHPEQAVTSNKIVKAPNYVSIPTSNITFREAFDIDPDQNGEFMLYWTPNYLCSKEALYKMTTQNQDKNMAYSHNWLGAYDQSYEQFAFTPIASYTPPASFVKYRLVSAGIRITYKGPVINRAGIVSHCLSYKSIPVVIYDQDSVIKIPANAIDDGQQNNGFGDQPQYLETSIIQNGMWNGVQNVQKDRNTFCVAVPTDPSDFIFEDDGYFYAAASAENSLNSTHLYFTLPNQQEKQFKNWAQLPQDGTPCSYIFKGTDLTVGAKLYVEQFYNFEVIPTEESAPILRPRMNQAQSEEVEKAKNLTNKILNDVKGEISNSVDKMITNAIKADTQINNELGNTNVPFRFVPREDFDKSGSNNNFETITFKPQRSNNKPFYKKAWDFTKKTGKKVFSQKNTENMAKIFGAFMRSYTGGK